MKNIPDKLFERNTDTITIGFSEIQLFSKNELEEKQIGYKIDSNGNKIHKWIGDNYLVIGIDSCCGDPIITNLNDEKLPVYSMFHDDWDSLVKITDDFNSYVEILNKINETYLGNKENKDILISYIFKIVPEEGKEYWESLLQCAYEFINDIN